MLLADHAQVAEGKLYINGGGWNVIGPGPTPFAIALYVEVPWDQTNTRHSLVLDLLDADGQPVVPPESENPIRIEFPPLEIGRPAGVKPGTPLGVSYAVNFGPVRLEPNGHYVWQLTIDGREDDEWRLPFSTRAAPSG